jgi:DNA-directed RNA polymerase specialized sigma24 family protein
LLETLAETGPLHPSTEVEALLVHRLTQPATRRRKEPPASLLSSEQLYRAELAHLSELTDEQIGELAGRARAGDTQARDALIGDAQHYVELWARRYSSAFSWASPHIDYAELIGIGNLTLVEHLPQALAKRNPCAYLATWARYSMFRCCTCHAGARLLSLDRPLGEESTLTLADLLPAPALRLEGEETSPSPAPALSSEELDQAISTLTPKQQEVLRRVYGLQEHAPERIGQITELCGTPLCEGSVSGTRDQALATLRQLLLSPTEACDRAVYTFAQVCQVLGVNEWNAYLLLRQHGITRRAFRRYPKAAIDALAAERAQRPRPEPAPVRWTPADRARFDQTHSALRASGEKITAERLARAAGRPKRLACAYLREIRCYTVEVSA